MKKLLAACILLVVSTVTVHAQYFMFSQQAYSELYLNPAFAASSDNISFTGLHRNQQVAADMAIRSTLFSAALPFLNDNGVWSGLGLTLLDDRSGANGLFRIQQAAAQYAVKIRLNYSQAITLGVNLNYQTREVSLTGLYTGSQYVPGRGFIQSVGTGEFPDELSQKFFNLGSGILWEFFQRDNTRIAELGLSFTNLYSQSYGNVEGQPVPGEAIIVHGRLHLTGNTPLSLDPTVRIMIDNAGSYINLGGTWQYSLNENQSLNLVTEYVLGKQAILGIQFETGRFSTGFSYDAVPGNKPGNQGAFEFGLKYSWKKQRRKRKLSGRISLPANSMLVPIGTFLLPTDIFLPLVTPQPVSQGTGKSSPVGDGFPGDLEYKPFVNDSLTLHLRYDVDAIIPNDNFLPALQKIAKTMTEENRSILIIGHTDSTGSAEYNLALSRRRAEFLRKQLELLGIPASAIQTEGRGEEAPISATNPAENRRVEFILR